ncbi:hypothetical protein [Paracoccus gahaiensis]|uniref:hypothetical protein n=1 Tax=Paracoccus gahaiensis TaxID=1706839 RepID=UPI00145D6A8F|nr:hypothetical protein [Paracoccus gahaiensis]
METKLTLSRAADLSGHNKSKIHRAIQKGALSASQPAPGEQYEIERSEFERVFPPKEWPSLNEVPERPQDTRSAGRLETGFDERSSILAVKLEATEARLAELQEALTRERDRADRFEDERQRLLEAPRTEVERERAERERERQEADRRDQERRDEAERLRNELERSRQEQDRLAREADELRQALLKPQSLWARLTGR